MNKETDLASSLLPAGLGLGGPPQPQNFPLKSLVHTVGKVMECSDKTQMFNEEDGMSEGASQKLRKAMAESGAILSLAVIVGLLGKLVGAGKDAGIVQGS